MITFSHRNWLVKGISLLCKIAPYLSLFPPPPSPLSPPDAWCLLLYMFQYYTKLTLSLSLSFFKRLVGGHETLNSMERVEVDEKDRPKVHLPGIALTQKSCIFTQTKSKKCIIEILMRPRTQGTDLTHTTCFGLSVYSVVCKTVGAICADN